MVTRYCEYCGDMVEYSTGHRPDTISIHGFDVHYEECYATCNECGHEIYVPELNDANIEAIEISLNNNKHCQLAGLGGRDSR